MSAYLDTGVIIALLYGETDSANKASASARLFSEIQSQRIDALITFYALPELFSYVERNYAASVNEVFRTSLVELFSFPLMLKPFVERSALELLRRRITIRDSYDLYHVAAALEFGCSAIVTFDHHFQQVSNLIPVFTPDEYLADVARKAQDE